MEYKIHLEPKLSHIFMMWSSLNEFDLKKDYYNAHKNYIKRLIKRDDGTEFCKAVETFFELSHSGGKKKIQLMRYIKDLMYRDVTISTKRMSIMIYDKELSITPNVYKLLATDAFDDNVAFEPVYLAKLFDLLNGELNDD